MALLFAATVCLYAFLPTIMTVTQALVEPRMRASAAALHSFAQTVAGLGIGSVLLGYLSDRLADSTSAGDYAAICLAETPGQAPASCAAAAATGLQHARMVVRGFLSSEDRGEGKECCGYVGSCGETGHKT